MLDRDVRGKGARPGTIAGPDDEQFRLRVPIAIRQNGGEVKLSQRPLWYASPTEPIDDRTPASGHRLPNAIEVYWLP